MQAQAFTGLPDDNKPTVLTADEVELKHALPSVRQTYKSEEDRCYPAVNLAWRGTRQPVTAAVYTSLLSAEISLCRYSLSTDHQLPYLCTAPTDFLVIWKDALVKQQVQKVLWTRKAPACLLKSTIGLR